MTEHLRQFLGMREIEHVAIACDIEHGERYCACGSEMDRVECELCDDGYTFDGQLHDQDPLWYSPRDVERCHQCGGTGGWWVCYEVLDSQQERTA